MMTRIGKKYLRFCLAALLALVPATHAAPALSAPPLTLPTQYGPIHGMTAGGVTAYLGIPYAAPPVGPRRWQPPVAPATWTAVRDASAFGNTCPQSTQIGYFANPSATEDCLYLNVFVPASADVASKRAVMVWFPGGGLYAGSSSEYDMSALVKAGVVVVSVNYRIGLLGFFAYPTLDAEQHDLGDYGIMDQQFALRWVQRNIASFAGDPSNVTIFGESSGAISSLVHLISPGSARLFARGIMESGGTPALTRVVTPLSKAEGNGQRFAEKIGCTDVACLRALPAQQIVAAQTPFLTGLIGNTATIPGTFHDAFTTGKFNRVPVIMGSNHDEWRWPTASAELNSKTPLTAERYPTVIAGFFGADSAAKIVAQYPPASYPSPSEALGAAETDGYIGCGTYKLDQWLSPFVPVYGYQFDDRNAPMYMPPVSFPYGAAHTIELQFVFPNFHGGATGVIHPLSTDEAALANDMVAYWTTFAKTGNPNAAGRPMWPKYDSSSDQLLSLNVPKPAVMTAFGTQHQCAFWDTVSSY